MINQKILIEKIFRIKVFFKKRIENKNFKKIWKYDKLSVTLKNETSELANYGNDKADKIELLLDQLE